MARVGGGGGGVAFAGRQAIGFTEALALEWAPTILVNTIAPGPIATDMKLKDMLPEWIEKEKDFPLRRLGEPLMQVFAPDRLES